MSFSEQYEIVQEKIAAACERSGRSNEDVRLLPVTKRFGPERVQEAVDCGLCVFGENRVQEAKQKIPLLPDHLVWHLIGHLQRNKVKDAVQLFSMIHSVDSLRLLEAIAVAADAAGRMIQILLEVKLSEEGTKHGLGTDEVAEVLEKSFSMSHVEVVGLMTLPPFLPEREDVRPYFIQLRELRDKLSRELNAGIPELSMGMSHDFEIAVEEGATWVRLGSGLFGEREG